MMVSLIILKFQSTLAEGNRISASLLVLPSLTTHYYAAVLSHLCSEVEMAFHPRWASFHNAKKAFQRGSLDMSKLCAVTMDWDKKKRDMGGGKKNSAEMWPWQLTARPWEISPSPSGTKIVQFTTPPALSTEVDWWHAAFFSFRDEVCHQTGGSEM